MTYREGVTESVRRKKSAFVLRPQFLLITATVWFTFDQRPRAARLHGHLSLPQSTRVAPLQAFPLTSSPGMRSRTFWRPRVRPYLAPFHLFVVHMAPWLSLVWTGKIQGAICIFSVLFARRVCGGGRQGWRLPNCKGAVPTDSANCSCARSLLVGVWGAAAQSGGDVWRAIGGAEALKNSVLLPLAFPRSTPILMRSMRGC